MYGVLPEGLIGALICLTDSLKLGNKVRLLLLSKVLVKRQSVIIFFVLLSPTPPRFGSSFFIISSGCGICGSSSSPVVSGGFGISCVGPVISCSGRSISRPVAPSSGDTGCFYTGINNSCLFVLEFTLSIVTSPSLMNSFVGIAGRSLESNKGVTGWWALTGVCHSACRIRDHGPHHGLHDRRDRRDHHDHDHADHHQLRAG